MNEINDEIGRLLADLPKGTAESLTPGEAARADEMRAEALRQAEFDVEQAERRRVAELSTVVDRFRDVMRRAGDVGTIALVRERRRKQQEVRGWILGQGVFSSNDLHVALALPLDDNVVYRAKWFDRSYWLLMERHAIGERDVTDHPGLPSPWKAIEDTIPVGIAQILAAHGVEWPG